jgi:hypothetical protein
MGGALLTTAPAEPGRKEIVMSAHTINNEFAIKLAEAIETTADQKDAYALVRDYTAEGGKLELSIKDDDGSVFSIVYRGGVFAVYNPDGSVRALSFDCDHVETDPIGATAFFILRSCDLIAAPCLESPETMG